MIVMDIKSTDHTTHVVHNQKTKTKNKAKDKKRLMSLIRGPKRVHELSYCLTEEESKQFKQIFADIMDENSDFRLHPKTERTVKSDTNQRQINESKLKNEMIFGINSVIRSVEKKCINGVILDNPLALPLVDNIMELCSDKQMPCLCVHSLHDLKSAINISSLSAIGLKPNITSNESVFYRLYQSFNEFILKNCSPIESNEPKVETIVTDEECHENVDQLEPQKSELNVNKNLFDILYVKSNEDNYHRLMSKHLDGESVSDKKTDDISTQESFLSFSCGHESYFPDIRKLYENIKIGVILDEKHIKSSDDSLARSLFGVTDGSDRKAVKRKLNEERSSDSFGFKSPQIVRLEASVHRRHDRQMRKQLKKQIKKSKNKR